MGLLLFIVLAGFDTVTLFNTVLLFIVLAGFDTVALFNTDLVCSLSPYKTRLVDRKRTWGGSSNISVLNRGCPMLYS